MNEAERGRLSGSCGNSHLLITVEGGEGAGKSTLVAELERRLTQAGRECVRTREPGGTPFAEAARALLLDPASSPSWQAELLTILAARADHIDHVIAPALEAGKVVLCDRFIDSTVAYQGGGRRLGIENVRALSLAACYGLLPALTLLLDLPVQCAAGRRRGRESVDRIEGAGFAFEEAVRRAFLQLAESEPSRIYLLDGSLPQEAVAEAAWRRIEGYFRCVSCRDHSPK